MKIVIYKNNEALASIDVVNEFLLRSFPNSDVKVRSNEELLCRVVVYEDSEVIAHGVAYSRQMKQGDKCFKGSIIAEVAVHPDYRGKGLCKLVLRSLESVMEAESVQHSFLFAYKPGIYKSSGYRELNLPIRFYDLLKEQWSTFAFQGSMYKSFGNNKLGNDVVDFNGWVY